MSDLKLTLASGVDLPFTFKRRPVPVPAETRPLWKIAALLFMLRLSSRGGKSSLKRLHLLNWAVRSPANRVLFADLRHASLPLFRFNVRFEPAFSRAIDLAVGNGLVSWVGGDRIQISAKGHGLVDDFLKDDSILSDERAFLTSLGKSLTESEADYVLGIKGTR
jgi:hypothetical protein